MAKFIQCDCCGAPATVHLTQIVNGVTTKINLCETCARARGILDPSGQPTLFLIEGASSLLKPGDPGNLGPHCDHCGWTLKQFDTTKRLGCTECYGTFHQAIEGLLRTVQRGTVHCGKIARFLLPPGKDTTVLEPKKVTSAAPKVARKRKTKAEKIQSLEAQLKVAVAEERYEDAIVLRDQIQKMKQRRQTKSQ